MICTKDGNRLIIAISGKQLSGKDALAGLLLELLPSFKRVGIGDAIKIELASIKNISLEELEQNKHIYRTELIELGNKGRTLDNGYYWINKVLETRGNLIIPDMRVLKEYQVFKNNGAIMIRVEANKETRLLRGTIVKEDDPTECALDNINDWDVVVFNDSTLNNLKKQAEQITSVINHPY